MNLGGVDHLHYEEHPQVRKGFMLLQGCGRRKPSPLRGVNSQSYRMPHVPEARIRYMAAETYRKEAYGAGIHNRQAWKARYADLQR